LVQKETKDQTFGRDSLEPLEGRVDHQSFTDEAADGVPRETEEIASAARGLGDGGEGGGLARLHVEPAEVDLWWLDQRGERRSDRAQLLQDGLDIVRLAHADPPGGDHYVASAHRTGDLCSQHLDCVFHDTEIEGLISILFKCSEESWSIAVSDLRALWLLGSLHELVAGAHDSDRWLRQAPHLQASQRLEVKRGGTSTTPTVAKRPISAGPSLLPAGMMSSPGLRRHVSRVRGEAAPDVAPHQADIFSIVDIDFDPDEISIFKCGVLDLRR
jgi:hypothetical protein